MPQLQNNFITTGDGQRIAYSLEGPKAAPVILFINSIATTRHMWDVNVPSFIHEYQILRYDVRGHGESSTPNEPYSQDRLGYDVIEMLDALQIEQVYVVGLSLGGLTAQWLAIHAPERVAKIVLANTFSYLGPRQNWDELIRKAQYASDMSEFSEMFINNWFPHQMIAANDSRIDALKQDIMTMQPVGLAGAFTAVRDADVRRTSTLIKCPTLVIGGEHDTVTSLDLSKDIANTIPGAQLEVFPAVHLTNIEFPERFNSIVGAFLIK